MDNFKKENKDIRDAIKNSIENQKFLPLISDILSLVVKRLPSQSLDSDLFYQEIFTVIHQRESWLELDRSLYSLEEVVKELDDVESTYKNYVTNMSYISKLLIFLTIGIITVIPVYILKNQFIWFIWIIALIELSIITIFLYLKAYKYSSIFENYENKYVR